MFRRRSKVQEPTVRLDLSAEELLADLDPGWLLWRRRVSDRELARVA